MAAGGDRGNPHDGCGDVPDRTRYERSRGRLPALGLSAFVLAGLLTAGWTVVMYSEGDTGDEGVWPGPSGLQVVEGEREGAPLRGCATTFRPRA